MELQNQSRSRALKLGEREVRLAAGAVVVACALLFVLLALVVAIVVMP